MRQLSRSELTQYLADHAVDLRQLDLAGFRVWLEDRISTAARQPLFAQRCLIRDLRRAHRRKLRDRERRLEAAEQAYRSLPAAGQLEEWERTIADLEKAVAGLSEAVAQGRADPAKLAQFQSRLADARQTWQQLRGAVPERRRLERARDSLAAFSADIGLTAAERELQQIGAHRGKVAGRAGSRFEELSSLAIHQLVLPQVSADGPIVLHGVTWGCARGEFDQVICGRRGAESDRSQPQPDFSDVLAIVEAKRNINDLVHGFNLRQENLAWLAGDPRGHQPRLYRTDQFPDGRFEGTAIHQEYGRDFLFDQQSFRRFQETDDRGFRLHGLYFVSEQRPLVGATTAELSRILHRAATDPRLQISSDAGLRRFRKWALSVVAPFQTRDVLKLYAASEELANQIVFC